MGMGTSSNILLSLILSVILLSGIASFQPFAFANGEDEKEDEKIKTFESECAKKLDKKNLNLDGLFCLAIFALQQSIADLQNQFDVLFVQKDLDTPVLFLQVDPDSREPALVVNDGINDVFTVNKDGSIQIGSNTIVLNPDGTVTGGPLLLEVGSKVDGNLIVAPSSPCNNKDLAQLKGGNWKCTKPEDIGSAAPNLVVLHYEQKDLIVVPASLFRPTINQLAVWEIVKDPTVAIDYVTILYDMSTYGQVRSTSGSFNVETGFFRSKDITFSPTGMNWDTIDTINSGSSTGFVGKLEIDEAITINSNINFIAFGTSNPFSGSGAGEVKEMTGTMTIHLPFGQTIKRVL